MSFSPNYKPTNLVANNAKKPQGTNMGCGCKAQTPSAPALAPTPAPTPQPNPPKNYTSCVTCQVTSNYKK